MVRGEVKPKTARTVAYLIQTLMQAIHISREEYVSAFGTEGWRKSIRNGVNANYDHRFPPASEPAPQQPASSTPLPSAPPPTQLRANARPNSAQPQSAAPKPNPAANAPQQAPSNNGPTSQTIHPNNPPPPAPPRPQPRPAAPTHDPYAVRFDHNYRLRSDGKLI